MKIPPFRVIKVTGVTDPNYTKVDKCSTCDKSIAPEDTIFVVRRGDDTIGPMGIYFNNITCSQLCANMCILANMDNPTGDLYAFTKFVYPRIKSVWPSLITSSLVEKDDKDK